jgi:hypothetical protein
MNVSLKVVAVAMITNNHPLYPAQEHVPVPWINIKGYVRRVSHLHAFLLKISKGEIVLTVSS